MPDTPVGDGTADYELTSADLGASIYCKVTANNASGTANANSNTVGPVVAASSGAYVYLVDTEGQGNDSIVTSAIDTTGADYLFVVMLDFSSNASITDSKGNVWDTSLAPATSTKIYQCHPTSVGPGHTVTLTSASPIYASACFLAFSGAATGEYDTQAAGDDVTPAAPITPAQNNSLILSIAFINTAGGGSSTIDEGFTKVCDLPRTSQLGLAVAYLIQTTAAEVSPTWTIPSGDGVVYITIAFSSTPLAMAKPSPES